MTDDPDIKKNVYTEDRIKKSNKSIFLPDNEKITYHSIILLELFNPKDIPNLIKGLDELYGDSTTTTLDKIEYGDIDAIKKDFENLKRKNGFRILPQITNSKFERPYILTPKSKKIYYGVSHDLGENIHDIKISFHSFSSSVVIVQFFIKLTSNISKDLNDIIYANYSIDDIEEYMKNTEINKLFPLPQDIKFEKINNLRLEIKKELIKTLSDCHLSGCFFKSSTNDISIVPSIDLFSLKYPENNKDILKWEFKNNDFLRGLKVSDLLGISTYKHDYFLIKAENDINYSGEFHNYVLFANKNSKKYDDEKITGNLSSIRFTPIAIKRLIEIYENVVEDLNMIIFEEIEDLDKNKLDQVIKSRKKISKKMFHFKRFRNEFKKDKFLVYDDFENINDRIKELVKIDFKEKIYMHETVNFFEGLIDNISVRIGDIDNVITNLDQNAIFVLNLKNIENAKITQDQTLNLSELTKVTQDRTLYLSIIVGILAVIQVVIGCYQLGINVIAIILNFLSQLSTITMLILFLCIHFP